MKLKEVEVRSLLFVLCIKSLTLALSLTMISFLIYFHCVCGRGVTFPLVAPDKIV